MAKKTKKTIAAQKVSKKKPPKGWKNKVIRVLLLGSLIEFHLWGIEHTSGIEREMFYRSVVTIFCYYAGLFVLIITGRIYNAVRYRKSSIRAIDRMTGSQFEHFLCVQFQRMGYKPKSVGGSYDYGADIILTKGRKGVTVVQAKRYGKERVGCAAVQQVAAAMSYYGANSSMVVTNSYFTSAAKNLAASNNVLLWDRDTLIENFNIKR